MTLEQSKKGFEYFFVAAFVGLTALIVFNDWIGMVRWIANYSVQVMLGFLAVGLMLFVFGKQRMMFISFGCCALLCMFLQKRGNANLVLPAYSAGSTITVAHANLTNITGSLEEAFLKILEEDADIISLQEVNLPLNAEVENAFKAQYPYISAPMKRNDFWSIVMMSKKPFKGLDTTYINNIPHLQGGITLDGEEQPVYFMSAYALPPFNQQSGGRALDLHLAEITSQRVPMDLPYIVVGDFNVAGWFDEMQDFREQNALLDSRRGYMPAVTNFFSYPIDHIFFSEQLKCVAFDIIKNVDAEHIGIVGTYQLSDSYLTSL